MKKPATTSAKAPKQAPRAPSSVRDRITQQDYEELKNTFDLFDEDGSGTIDPIQIQKVMEQLGLTRRNATVGDIINDLRSANRSLRFDDFLDIVVGRVGQTKTQQGLSKVFGLYDKNADGYIDFDEFKQIARQLGQTMNDDEITEMMHNAYILNNTSTNEAFNFEEFSAIVTKKR